MDRNEFQSLNAHIKCRIDELQLHVGDSAKDKDGNDTDKSDDDSSDVQRQLAKKELQELARLKSNLLWLDSEDGGYCESCSAEIPIARLRAVPITRLCINCAK